MSAPLPSLRPPVAAAPVPTSYRASILHYYGWHLGLPLLLFLGLSVLLLGLHGDQWLADRIYAWEGQRWSLQHQYLTEQVLHEEARKLCAVVWVALALSWSLTWLPSKPWRSWRRPLGYLLAATLLSTLLVGWMKSWTNMDCPWDLLRYGGERAYHGLFAARSAAAPAGRCFPAGHASGGYAWVALYFFFAATRPRLRWLGLGVGLGAGALFGAAQQLRGAHFLSHDVWTLMICWCTALALQRLMRLPEESKVASRSPARAAAA